MITYQHTECQIHNKCSPYSVQNNNKNKFKKKRKLLIKNQARPLCKLKGEGCPQVVALLCW